MSRMTAFCCLVLLACTLNGVVSGAHNDHLRNLLKNHHRHRAATATDQTGCTVDGVKYPPGHTMCLPSAANMTPNPPTDAEKQECVDRHNEYRAGVDPNASDMMKMYWDDEIAMIAQKWVETCPPSTMDEAHDKDRSVPAYGIGIGQNGAFGTVNFTSAVNMWYKEVKDFTYGAGNDFKIVGHFTQVVSGHSNLVGCGRSYCPDHVYKNILFCNYAFGQEGINEPYKREDAGCANTCGAHCKNNLCDCGEKFCRNGGTLNTATCTCNCLSLFSGDVCEIVTCPKTQPDCNKWGDSPNCDYSKTINDCPFKCGLCDPPCDGMECQNGGQLDPDACTCSCTALYSGTNCETLNCPKTESSCYKWGTPAPCGYIPTANDCPFTCGICDPPCNGMKCENGGTLDPDACTCSCSALYAGDTCQTLNCPDNENLCYRWGGSPSCSYGPTKNDCPFTCGVCEPPCGGTNCQNGGTLDTSTCACSCLSLYSGATCETVNCPAEETKCWRWGSTPMCSYGPTKVDCPYTCEVCPAK